MTRHSTVRARCREIPSRSHDVFAKSLKFPRESLSVSVFLALAEAARKTPEKCSHLVLAGPVAATGLGPGLDDKPWSLP